jgi:UDP-glucose-4-epimerase GalE
MSTRERILVTGGAGFVGSHFVRAAHEAGSHVVVLDNLSAGAHPALPEDVDVVCGDINNRSLVRQTIREDEISAVVHFAGLICAGDSVESPAVYFETNVTKTLALLDTVLKEGVATFVFSSSAAVYGKGFSGCPIPEDMPRMPINPYGATKLTIEHALEAYGVAHGLRWAALRYFNACGAHPDGTLREVHKPETHLIPNVIDATWGRRAPLVIHGDGYSTRDGTCERDYVHVMDLARAHLAALTALHQGVRVGCVNLGSEVGRTVREVIRTAEDVLGKLVPLTLGPARAGDPATLIANCTRAWELLQWSPKHDLTMMIEDAARSRR